MISDQGKLAGMKRIENNDKIVNIMTRKHSNL